MHKLPQTNSLKLSDEELETISDLAALNYTLSQMAMYLDIDVTNFAIAAREPNSAVQHYIDKGQLQAEFEVNQKLLESAKGGNLTAGMMLEKIRDRNIIEQIKSRILFHEG